MGIGNYKEPLDILHPTPEEMTFVLLEAAQAERWNHWRHELEAHDRDWVKVGDTRHPLQREEFAELPTAVARYPFVELCVYGYGHYAQVVWGFFCKKLPIEGEILSWVLVVYDPVAGEIIHCMRPDRGKRYCTRWGEQTKLFVSIRWKL
jgi:hypothetical protein